MLIIQKLSEMIEEEICDSEKYIRCALNHKDQHPALADLFARMSDDEMRHMSLLHEQVVKFIEMYRKEKGEPPEGMMAVYNYMHQRHIDHTAEVKRLQEMYKNG